MGWEQVNKLPGLIQINRMIIDSHVHFWKYDKLRDAWITSDMKILRQDYLPEHLAVTLKRNDVDGCVAVQANQSEVETRFLSELTLTHPVIKGVVGWIDLQHENIEERLLHFFSHYPVIKGYRHIVQAEPDVFLLKEEFQRGMAALKHYDYTYDILIYPRQINAATKLVSRFPEQKFVIDHCAKPDIRNRNIDEWKLLIKELAQHPNVYCKLSGLFTEARWKEWNAGDFYPYLDIIFEAFGTRRLLFGSDWPVMLLSGIYIQWKSLLEKYMEHLKMEERENVMGLNAKRFYNL
jgi:L-fuconolactonase